MKLAGWMSLEFLSPLQRSLCLAAGGLVLGLGVLVASISNAGSYLSDDPRACINCHVMTPQYATWQHSSHAEVATCNDCHVPQDSTLRKYCYKAMDGARHSALFTLRMERQVIQATERSKAVIQENCVRCHQQQLVQARTKVHSSIERSCTSCHREVPHGRVHSLSSTPNAAVPPLPPATPRFMRTK
jgi:cytochrome c nitrite reductase small subunit